MRDTVVQKISIGGSTIRIAAVPTGDDSWGWTDDTDGDFLSGDIPPLGSFDEPKDALKAAHRYHALLDQETRQARQALVAMARRGGMARSVKKAEAARRNGMLGGRPRKSS